MKKYEKPILVALSLCGNEVLCSGCAGESYIQLKENSDLANQVAIDLGLDDNGDKIGTRDELYNAFTTSDGCTDHISPNITIDKYFKFTSSMNILWS